MVFSQGQCLSTEHGNVEGLSGDNILYDVLAIKCNDPDWHIAYKNAFFDLFAQIVIIIIAYAAFVARKMLHPAYAEGQMRLGRIYCSEVDYKSINSDRYCGERMNLIIQSGCMLISFCGYMIDFTNMDLNNNRSHGSCSFCVYIAIAALKPFFVSSLSFAMSAVRAMVHRMENGITTDTSSGSTVDSFMEIIVLMGYAVLMVVYLPALAYSVVTIPFVLQWFVIVIIVMLALTVAAALGALFAITSNWIVGIGSVTKDAFSQKHPVHLLFYFISVTIGLFFSLYLLHDCGWIFLTEAFFEGLHYSTNSGFSWPLMQLSLMQRMVMLLSLTSSASYLIDYMIGSVVLLCIPRGDTAENTPLTAA